VNKTFFYFKLRTGNHVLIFLTSEDGSLKYTIMFSIYPLSCWSRLQTAWIQMPF